MNSEKTTSCSIRFPHQHVSQTGEENHPLALTGSYRSKPLPLELAQLQQILFESVIQHMRGLVSREYETFSSTCIGYAQKIDGVYLAQVQRFQDMVSSRYEEIMCEYDNKLK